MAGRFGNVLSDIGPVVASCAIVPDAGFHSLLHCGNSRCEPRLLWLLAVESLPQHARS
jgi:hypothetical protein